MAEADAHLFTLIGFDEKKAAETAKNKDLTHQLKTIIAEAGVEQGCDKAVGNILYTLATKYPANALAHRPVLARFVAEKKVTATNLQPSLDYLKKVGAGALDVEAFKTDCGVGVVISKDQIATAVRELLTEKKAELEEKRYRINIGIYLQTLRNKLKWADGKLLSDELNEQVAAVLGPRTAEDDKKVDTKAKAKEPEKKDEKPKEKAEKKPEDELELPPQESIRFPAPEENIQNTPELLKQHLAETGGKIRTRFPPEPNGYLHIGHAKAMHLDFGYAKKNGGVCYLRFDDTNPEKEEKEYFDSIIDNVKWMGWEPWKITYSSSYFPQLYELAVQLIKIDKAYVCHLGKEEMREGRKTMVDSPYRNRTVEENLRLFEDMRRGKFAEGECCLRFKGDMKHDNPNMRDLVAYRVKYVPHPVAGNEWCVYPSYDFTHCLVDSIEHVTHSLCTLEFERRRESYNWLVDVLGLYRPLVWEFSRLNLTNTVLSKRKIIRLVKEKYVRGWDDPRMSTINAFRRKGYTAEAINLFCEKIGVTRAPNTISYSLLEQCCRLDLDPKVHRAMVVLHPLKVVLTNIPEDAPDEEITVKNHPFIDMGTHKVPLSRVVYIERSDFRVVDEKGYFGLAPGKEGMLKYAYNIKVTDFVQDSKTGEVTEIHATVDRTNATKVKGVFHWVAESKTQPPLTAEVRLYERLFTVENPNELKDDFLDFINPNSEQVITGAKADVSFKGVKVGDRFQFERQGFFVVDKDTKGDALVFNRTVTLKESKSLKEMAPKPTSSSSSAAKKK